MASFADQVAVVTGRSAGIGRQIALDLAADRATVVAGDVRAEPQRGERYGND